MTSTGLSLPASSLFFSVVAEPRDVATEILGWQQRGLVVRAIRGRKARTVEALFDEFAAALQFPYYFGENWSAFGECIADLDWLPFKPGVVVVVYAADHVLADAHPAELGTLVRALAAAADEFARPITQGEWWDRGPVPFHVVLHGDTERDHDRWRAAGAQVVPLALGQDERPGSV